MRFAFVIGIAYYSFYFDICVYNVSHGIGICCFAMFYNAIFAIVFFFLYFCLFPIKFIAFLDSIKYFKIKKEEVQIQRLTKLMPYKIPITSLNENALHILQCICICVCL